MNDRTEGAIEVLAWVLSLAESVRKLDDLFDEVRRARDDLFLGVSVDFRQRIKTRP